MINETGTVSVICGELIELAKNIHFEIPRKPDAIQYCDISKFDDVTVSDLIEQSISSVIPSSHMSKADSATIKLDVIKDRCKDDS